MLMIVAEEEKQRKWKVQNELERKKAHTFGTVWKGHLMPKGGRFCIPTRWGHLVPGENANQYQRLTRWHRVDNLPEPKAPLST